MSRMELIDHLNAPLLHRCMRKAALCLPAAVGICDGHVESGGSKKPKHLRFGSSMCQPHKLNYPAFIKIDSSQQKYMKFGHPESSVARELQAKRLLIFAPVSKIGLTVQLI